MIKVRRLEAKWWRARVVLTLPSKNRRNLFFYEGTALPCFVSQVASPHVTTRLLFSKRSFARARSWWVFFRSLEAGHAWEIEKGPSRYEEWNRSKVPPMDPLHIFSSAVLLASHIAVTSSSCGADQASVMRSLSFVDVEHTCMRYDAHRERCDCAFS
jgi:hypothetical protein